MGLLNKEVNNENLGAKASSETTSHYYNLCDVTDIELVIKHLDMNDPTKQEVSWN